MSAGCGLLCIAAISEFVGVEWWSTVNLQKLRQYFVIFKSGQVAIGTRGTGGFFNRRIPTAGAEWIWPRDYTREPWSRRFVPRTFDAMQTKGVSIPVVSPGLVLAAAGGFPILSGRCQRAGLCRQCGYDLSGLSAAECPECGTLRSS